MAWWWYLLPMARITPARPGRSGVVEREQAILGCTPGCRSAAALNAHPSWRSARPHLRMSSCGNLRTSPANVTTVLCLDIDNGPEWTMTDDNQSVYAAAGLAALERVLTVIYPYGRRPRTGIVQLAGIAIRPGGDAEVPGCQPTVASRPW